MRILSFVTQQATKGVTEIVTTHQSVSIVQSQINSPEVKFQIDSLHGSLSNHPPYTVESAEQVLATHANHLDCALIVHKDRVLTMATSGSGIIFLKRKGKLVEIVADTLSAQGPILDGDEFILTTGEFLDLVGGLEGLEYYFLKYPSEEVVEMMKTYEDQSVACGFATVIYGEAQPPSVGDDQINKVIDTSQVPILSTDGQVEATPDTPKDKSNVNMPNIGKLVQTILHKIASIVTPKFVKIAVMIVVPLSVIIFLFIRAVSSTPSTTVSKPDNLQTLKVQVEATLKEVETKAFVDIQSVEPSLAEIRKRIDNLSSSDKSKYATEIQKLSDQINSKENEFLRIDSTSPEEYFDLSVEAKDATASDADYNGVDFYLLDSSRGVVYVVDGTSRSYESWPTDKLKGAKLITASDKYAYVLTAKDGIYLIQQDKSVQVIKPDATWGQITDMKYYAGNIYILDAGRKNIYKYSGVDEKTFGDATSYLVEEQQGNLASNSRFTVDGSIYTAGKASIIKFTTGRKADFALLMPYKDITISALYTNPDTDKLYVFDSMHQMLSELTKEGVYDKQWKIKQSVIAIGVGDKGQSIFVITGKKIFKM